MHLASCPAWKAAGVGQQGLKKRMPKYGFINPFIPGPLEFRHRHPLRLSGSPTAPGVTHLPKSYLMPRAITSCRPGGVLGPGGPARGKHTCLPASRSELAFTRRKTISEYCI